MRRYVIELRPDCKVVQQICESNGQVCIGARSIQYLEELTADYINEHFGDLQDTAYQKGYADGRMVGIKDGMCEAWEAARNIIHMPEGDLLNIFTECYSAVCTALQVLLKYDASEAIAKLKAYEKKQDGKPIIGEVVVRYLNGKRDGVGVFLGEDGDYWNCLFWTGATFGTFAYPSNQFKRTGNVCDITKILEAMKND